MKNLWPYFLFSFVSCVIAVLLSIIFHFSLSNTWQAGVALIFIFGPYLIYGWKRSAEYYEKYPFACLLVRTIISLFIMAYIIASLVILL